MPSRMKLVVVSLTVLLVAALLVGQVAGRNSNPEDTYRHLAIFVEVMSRIKGEYVEEPDMKNVTLGALNGLLESIDPYASYLNADQYKQYLKNKDLKRADVGLVLSRRFGYISIVDAIPGSPADKAGLGTGDILETIAGVGSRDMPLAYAELLLQGDAGSTVDLSVLRVRKPEPQKISLARAIVKYPAVTAKLLPDGIGHIQIQSFEPGKTKEIAASIKDLEKQGAKKLVLDLRNSAAGSTEEGITAANLFLDKGVITTRKGQRVRTDVFNAESEKTIWKGPLVVITNRGTAAGAELVAAALLENKRAEIVGERTYGDAAQRKAITMEDGSAVILAIAKYYSPNNKAIQDHPIAPTHAVAEIDVTPVDDEDAATPAQPEKKPSDAADALLKKALEVLNGAGKAAQKNNEPRTVAQLHLAVGA